MSAPHPTPEKFREQGHRVIDRDEGDEYVMRLLPLVEEVASVRTMSAPHLTPEEFHEQDHRVIDRDEGDEYVMRLLPLVEEGAQRLSRDP